MNLVVLIILSLGVAPPANLCPHIYRELSLIAL